MSSLLRKAGALIVAVGAAEFPIWIYRAYVGVVHRQGGQPVPQEVYDHVITAGRRGGQASVDGPAIR
jgi:hypothetical protein